VVGWYALTRRRRGAAARLKMQPNDALQRTGTPCIFRW